jgi:putative ABC transport system permease protein
MLPRSPSAGKRILLEYIPFIWNSMKFTHKVTARNLMRRKRYFFMTVTGIAGCTALMIAGFGLHDSMVDIAHTQFSNILQYDAVIELNDDADTDSTRDIESLMDDSMRWTAVHNEAGFVIQNDRVSAFLIVPKDPSLLGNFINLRNRKTRTPIIFSENSVIISEKLAERLNLTIGGTITIENANALRGVFTVSGITENYVGVYCYIAPSLYKTVFGDAENAAAGIEDNGIEYRTLYMITNIKDKDKQDAFASEMLLRDGVMVCSFASQIQTSYNNLLTSINLVVMVLILASGGLAVIVIYNLTNINIDERKREIATLRVLGFHQSEAAAYIFREITVLSVVGTLIGLFLGIPLHRFIIGVAENTDLMFGRSITPLSFVLSAIFTLIFSGIVDLLMLPKLRGIKMAESMKAAE